MRGRRFVIAMAVMAASVTVLAQNSAEDRQTVENIRSALIRLPYYGVFDFLTFSYEKGTVTLSGFAYRSALKDEAKNAVRRVPRVDDVIDQIEELPVSSFDDQIRWATFYRIYNDDFLSRYAAGGGLTRFDRRFDFARYPNMQPLGMYAIHIVVNRQRTLLVGLVDSETDKTIAGFRAREIPSTFGVDNELVVAKKDGTR